MVVGACWINLVLVLLQQLHQMLIRFRDQIKVLVWAFNALCGLGYLRADAYKTAIVQPVYQLTNVWRNSNKNLVLQACHIITQEWALVLTTSPTTTWALHSVLVASSKGSPHRVCCNNLTREWVTMARSEQPKYGCSWWIDFYNKILFVSDSNSVAYFSPGYSFWDGTNRTMPCSITHIMNAKRVEIKANSGIILSVICTLA